MHTNDPSQVEQRHLEDFLRDISHLAATYINKAPLILIGIDKYISYYRKVENVKNIIGELHANHDRLAPHEINQLTWPIVATYQAEQEKTLIQNVRQQIVRKEAIAGIDAVLQNLDERPHHLIVEKDFEVAGYLSSKGQLTLTKTQKESKAIPNLVEHLLEKVLRKKNGKVAVVSPNALAKEGHIVLMNQ